MGSFITFISYPVMSGFTTGAAMSIGLSQVKNAFGFPSTPSGAIPYNHPSSYEGPITGKQPPQQGQIGYDYGYQIMQWFVVNWNTKFTALPTATAAQKAVFEGNYAVNPLCVALSIGVFVPIVIINYFKSNVFKATAERKKRWSYWIFNIVVSLMPFLALVSVTSISQVWLKKSDDFYNKTLNVVGTVPAGLNILRTPTLRQPFGPFFIDCITIALILFMESYSVARRIASNANELWILNASQVRDNTPSQGPRVCLTPSCIPNLPPPLPRPGTVG